MAEAIWINMNHFLYGLSEANTIDGVTVTLEVSSFLLIGFKSKMFSTAMTALFCLALPNKSLTVKVEACIVVTKQKGFHSFAETALLVKRKGSMSSEVI